MIRFIILFAVGYVLYRSLKSWMFPSASTSKSASNENTSEIVDVMIKDPFCEAYFAKRSGVHLNFGGENLYFCSHQCKDKYLAAHTDAKE
jgi:YHS domain-containing protein